MFSNQNNSGGNDLLEGVAETYAIHTLSNALQFSGILSSFLLEKRVIRGINEYYALQMVMVRILYQGAMLLADRIVHEKLGDENRRIFLRRMAAYYTENAAVQIAKHLAEYEPSIKAESIESESAESFKDDYNTVSTSISIRMNESGKSIQETVANYYITSFLDSFGYGNLVPLDEKKVRDIGPTFIEMLCSFFAEFNKDIVNKLIVINPAL